MSLIEKELK